MLEYIVSSTCKSARYIDSFVKFGYNIENIKLENLTISKTIKLYKCAFFIKIDGIALYYICQTVSQSSENTSFDTYPYTTQL